MPLVADAKVLTCDSQIMSSPIVAFQIKLTNFFNNHICPTDNEMS